jgi:hypothetical protein
MGADAKWGPDIAWSNPVTFRAIGYTKQRALSTFEAATQYPVAGGDAISLPQKLGHTTLAMASQYVHLAAQNLAAMNEQVPPMGRVRIKPLNRPYRKAKR